MRGRRRQVVLLSVVAALVALAFVVRIWAVAISDPAPYATVLDELAVPDSWQLVHTSVMAPGGRDGAVRPGQPSDMIDCAPLAIETCPSVTRYYTVRGAQLELYGTLKSLVTSAGFTIDTSWPGCTPSVAQGEESCLLAARRGSMELWIRVYRPGGQTLEGMSPPDPASAIVSISARGS